MSNTDLYANLQLLAFRKLTGQNGLSVSRLHSNSHPNRLSTTPKNSTHPACLWLSEEARDTSLSERNMSVQETPNHTIPYYFVD